MRTDQIAAATTCVNAAHDGSLSFPEIVGRLSGAGFESYVVDYRQHQQTFFLPDGEAATLPMVAKATAGNSRVAALFDAPEMARLVRWAQTNPAEYSYAAFSQKAKSAGCAGYMVSFLGRRVVYFGRTAETNVELFPQ